jgi:hypothetical protein
MTEPREQAHQLIDRLPETQVSALVGLLKSIVDPVAATLHYAPIDDDEEPAAEDRRALTASREYFRQNPEGGIPFEQVVAKCGFTMDQVRPHQGE